VSEEAEDIVIANQCEDVTDFLRPKD